MHRLEAMHAAIEKLSPRIVYVPGAHIVRDISRSRRPEIDNLSEVKYVLEPIQQRFGDKIISSAMIMTPEKMQHAMQKDPWEFLQEIRPRARAKLPTDPDMVPILFEDQGILYMGWQKRGALPTLFDCEYDPDSSLWLPPLQNVGSMEHRTIATPQWQVELVDKSNNRRLFRVHLEHETHTIEYKRWLEFETVKVDGQVVDRGWDFPKKIFKFHMADGGVIYQASFEALPSNILNLLRYHVAKWRLIIADRVLYTENWQ